MLVIIIGYMIFTGEYLMPYDLVVIGGGPAGMLAALTAAQQGTKVLILEKNEKLGKKLYITGKGRCNVTNNGTLEDFINSINTNKKFLYSAFNKFDNHSLITLLNDLGVKTKVERGNRVFPESDKSSDIINALQRQLIHLGVEIKYHATVDKILTTADQVSAVMLADGTTIPCNNVVIATGGVSYPNTGSTGDGYRLASGLGHTVVTPKPALIPLLIAEDWAKTLQGLALKNVTATLVVNKKKIDQQFGEMLFTHFGISGPIILTLSSLLKNAKGNHKKILLDLKPALTEEQLDKRLQRDFEKYANKQLQNALGELLPKRLIPVVINVTGIHPEKTVHQITRAERLQLLQTLKQLELTVTGTRPINEAIVTSGGIKTTEINPSTMESKLVKGLYFAGEIIDVDAVTGGYNLQIAFSTGYLSGFNAAQN